MESESRLGLGVLTGRDVTGEKGVRGNKNTRGKKRKQTEDDDVTYYGRHDASNSAQLLFVERCTAGLFDFQQRIGEPVNVKMPR